MSGHSILISCRATDSLAKITKKNHFLCIKEVIGWLKNSNIGNYLLFFIRYYSFFEYFCNYAGSGSELRFDVTERYIAGLEPLFRIA